LRLLVNLPVRMWMATVHRCISLEFEEGYNVCVIGVGTFCFTLDSQVAVGV
jgi:hypothetical protein